MRSGIEGSSSAGSKVHLRCCGSSQRRIEPEYTVRSGEWVEGGVRRAIRRVECEWVE